jgi:large subunit ribosomal protein L29
VKKAQALAAIRQSNGDELLSRMKRLEEELFQHRLKRYTNQLENTNLIRSARREIARCKTVLAMRALSKEVQPQGKE